MIIRLNIILSCLLKEFTHIVFIMGKTLKVPSSTSMTVASAAKAEKDAANKEGIIKALGRDSSVAKQALDYYDELGIAFPIINPRFYCKRCIDGWDSDGIRCLMTPSHALFHLYRNHREGRNPPLPYCDGSIEAIDALEQYLHEEKQLLRSNPSFEIKPWKK